MKAPKIGVITGDIPVPLHGNIKYPWAYMLVGDSILVPRLSRSAAHAAANKHRFKFVTKVEGQCVRVWRVA